MDKSDQIRDITEKLEKGLMDLFQSDRYRNYLDTLSKFHNYSFNNSLLISMQRPDATYVAGYRSWETNFDRHVEKGEKAIKIIAPAPYKKVTETPVLDENGSQRTGLDGRPETRREETIVPSFKVISVFDVSQTTGRELPSICRPLENKLDGFERFQDALERISPVPLRYDEISTGANGFYSISDKSITIKSGMAETQTAKTMIHEIAHSILHDRDSGTDLHADARTREVQAESVAYTVCQHYGIDTSDYSFGYIAGWSSGKELKELRDSMDTIRDTACSMIRSIDHELDIIRLEHTDRLIYEYSGGFMEISKDEQGYGYRTFDENFRKLSEGQVSNADLRIDEAAQKAVEQEGIQTVILEETNYSLVPQESLAHTLNRSK